MEEELLKRWRLILGGDEADGTGVTLNLEEQQKRGAGFLGSQSKPMAWRYP